MADNHTLGSTRRMATNALIGHSDSAQIDADCVMCYALNIPRSRLFSHPEITLERHQIATIKRLISRVKSGEPVAYITGVQEFWSLPIKVTPSVLIPRPATETLVEQALQHIPVERNFELLELGTGSGAVAIALASERPKLSITATDICHDALKLAHANSNDHKLTSIRFVQSDWFDAIAAKRFDMIVSNPPYIADGDNNLAPNVQKFEPVMALISQNDGLNAIKHIVRNAGGYLRDKGHLMLEHGWQQQESVEKILRAHSFTSIRCYLDLDGLPRVTSARL